MRLIVGSARIDENDNLKNGKAGDQTGKKSQHKHTIHIKKVGTFFDQKV